MRGIEVYLGAELLRGGWVTLERAGWVKRPVSFPQLQQMQAVLHALHLLLMHPCYKHARVTLSDLQVLIFWSQQVLQPKHNNQRLLLQCFLQCTAQQQRRSCSVVGCCS